MGSNRSDRPEGWTAMHEWYVKMAGPAGEQMRLGLESAIANGLERNQMMTCQVCGAVEKELPSGRTEFVHDIECGQKSGADKAVLKMPKRTRSDLDDNDETLDRFTTSTRNRGGHD